MHLQLQFSPLTKEYTTCRLGCSHTLKCRFLVKGGKMQQRKTNVGLIRMNRQTRQAISVFCEALSDQNPSTVSMFIISFCFLVFVRAFDLISQVWDLVRVCRNIASFTIILLSFGHQAIHFLKYWCTQGGIELFIWQQKNVWHRFFFSSVKSM